MPLTSVTQNPSQAAAIVVAFAAGVAVGANWPKIRKSLAPLLAVTGDKFGDVYSALAQIVGEQKESMEDARAERRHRRRGKAAAGAEQELLAGLAAALLQGKKRAQAKPVRKRPAARSRKVTAPTTTPAAVDGNA
jgi:hypothetical protein